MVAVVYWCLAWLVYCLLHGRSLIICVVARQIPLAAREIWLQTQIMDCYLLVFTITRWYIFLLLSDRYFLLLSYRSSIWARLPKKLSFLDRSSQSPYSVCANTQVTQFTPRSLDALTAAIQKRGLFGHIIIIKTRLIIKICLVKHGR